MQLSRARRCLLGLACGDAVGTTVEFQPRGSFPLVTDMVGGGPFQLPPGAWTDDTSMALCLAASLVESPGFDPPNQMRRYCDWQEHGVFSSTGVCFDIGLTVQSALDRFRRSGDPFSGSTDPRSAGDGCLMWLAPVPIFFSSNAVAAARWAGDRARTTHGALECIEACQLFACMLCTALVDGTGDEILFGHPPEQFQSPKVRAIAAGEYRPKRPREIRGSGYVIDGLEAAAWSFWRTDSFRDAVRAAVNLGDDADTTGAACGQIAGAFYGEAGIPAEWLAQLVMVNEVRDLADRLAQSGSAFPAAGERTTND